MFVAMIDIAADTQWYGVRPRITLRTSWKRKHIFLQHRIQILKIFLFKLDKMTFLKYGLGRDFPSRKDTASVDRGCSHLQIHISK